MNDVNHTNKFLRFAILAGILFAGFALPSLPLTSPETSNPEASSPAAPSLPQDQAGPPQGGYGQGGQGGGSGRGRGRGGRGRGATDALPEEAPAVVPKAPASTKKVTSAEQFFIVASIDQAKSQILFKRPTEVTLLMNVDAKTKYTDDAKNPLKLANLRTGDTVWVLATGVEDEPTAVSIRKGQMTVAQLHNLYLDYPIIK